jgi:flagellar biosynthetic protein FliR
MSLSLDPIWLIGFFLVFVRALAWLVIAPPFSNRAVVPLPAKVGIAGGLAVLSASHVAAANTPTTTPALLGALVVQVLSGVLLALPVLILVSALTSAGAFVDLFGGLNLPPSMDPLSQTQNPLVAQLYEQVALVLLFATNGELLVVRGFAESLGNHGMTLQPTEFAANLLTSDLATYFTAALEIAAPIVVVLFATQMALALLARSAPQLNVWMLGFPLQTLISILLVALAIRVLPGFVENIVSRIVQDMAALARGH